MDSSKMNGGLAMQVQKDEIRSKILEAALDEFLVAGYSQSSMRNIAAQAGITVGNIYSYFSGKEDLFESVVSEVVEQLRSLVLIKVPGNDPVSTSSIAEMTHAVNEVFLNNRNQFLVLMYGSAGSRYENLKDSLIELAQRRLQAELEKMLLNASIDPLLTNSLAVAMIEGILNIFRRCGNDGVRRERLLAQFLTVVVGDLYRRL